MDGTVLQPLLYSGYAKVAQKVGFDYAQYRSSTHLLPITAGNLLRTIPVAISADEKFSVSKKYHVPTWRLWADGRLLQQFDFLVGRDGTFFVADMQPNLPMQAVRANHVVSIGRVDYSEPASPTIVNYATGLPVCMQYKREEIKSSPFQNVIGEAITRWLTFIPLPAGTIKQDDVIFDEEGIRYIMDAPDFTDIGYVASMRKATL